MFNLALLALRNVKLFPVQNYCVQVHYPTMVVPSSDPGRLLVTYTRSYNNRTAHATSNNGVGGLEDGIWIAEMALPVAGAMELIGAPIRSLKMTESF